MATVNLTGLSTGIDTAAIVQQLMQVASRRLTLMQNSETSYKGKRTAVTELQSKLFSFKSALNNISDTSKLKAFNATASDEDVITAEANANATEGSHVVKIEQLASAEREVHIAGVDSANSYLGNGNFIFSYNYKEMAIQTTDTTTLQDLANKINSDPENPGVTASILFHNNKYHLVLAGKNPGSENIITINDQNTEMHESQTALKIKSTGGNASLTTKLTELDTFTGSFGTGDTITITRKDRSGTPLTPDYNFNVNQYSTVKDLLSGIESAFSNNVKAYLDNGTIIVTDKTSGTSSFSVDNITLNSSSAALTIPQISRKTEGGTKSILTDYASSAFTETQAAKDALIRVDGYPAGEWIARGSNTIDDVIAGVTLHLHATTGTNDVEVNTTRNTKELKDKINSMIEGYNTVIMYLDEKTKYDTENKKTGVLSRDYSLTSIRSLIKNPLLSIASGFGSNDEFTCPRDIGIEIDADGMLKLDEKTFDEAVVKDYQDVLSLIGAQKTGLSTGSDAAYISFYAASKYTTAGVYDVEVVVNETTHEIDSARIKTSSQTWDQARWMTVDDDTLRGSSEYDANGRPLYPEFDLHLTVDTSQTGTLDATISVKQGFAGSLYETVDQTIQTGSGRVPIAKKSIDEQISQVEKRMEKEQERLDKVETSLKQKFARLERLLSQIQQQMATITNMAK
jgi:flagellar capping protein FliD